MPDVREIPANSSKTVVVISKARAHTSLILNRNGDHKVRGISRTYDVSLYCLTRRKLVLSLSVCRVPTVACAHKIS